MIITPVSTMSPVPSTVLPVGPIRLNHYESTEDVDWHMKIQATLPSDPTFAAPLSALTKDSSSDQSNWYWRDDQIGAGSQALVAVPAGGMATKRSLRRERDNVGAVFYFYTTAELADLEVGDVLLVRAAQWNGAAWGDWIVLDPITVPG
jgi:hypothetical protein